MNRCVFLAFLGRDPEIRYAQGTGNAVATFSIAVNRRFRKESDPEADWFNCIAFAKRAEFCERYLKKGSKVIIEGEVQNDNYEKDGVKHYGTKIIVDNIEFAESRKAQEERQSEYQQAQQPTQQYQPQYQQPVQQPQYQQQYQQPAPQPQYQTPPQQNPQSAGFMQAIDDDLPFN